jgi:small subunit ribosomal protein S13
VPRIAGIDVPDRKKIYFALQYIHGIGPKFAKDILPRPASTRDQRANEWTRRKLPQINAIIDAATSSRVPSAARCSRTSSASRTSAPTAATATARASLPVRGQRTQSNARTRKGRKKTVAGKKGVKAK